MGLRSKKSALCGLLAPRAAKRLFILYGRGSPDFPLLCELMLMRRHHVRITYVIFDVLSLDGSDLMRQPYHERRRQLESLNLNNLYWRTPEAFDDGEALFEAVCERELEGIVAMRREGRYRPGERGWVKIKEL